MFFLCILIVMLIISDFSLHHFNNKIILASTTAVFFTAMMFCIDISGSFAAACHFHSDFTYTMFIGLSTSIAFFILSSIHKAKQTVKAKNQKQLIQKIEDNFFPQQGFQSRSSHHVVSQLPDEIKKIIYDYYWADYTELIFITKEFGLSKEQMKRTLQQDIPSHLGINKKEFVYGIILLIKAINKIPKKLFSIKDKHSDPINLILYNLRELSLDDKYQIFCWIACNRDKWCPQIRRRHYKNTPCLSVAIRLLLKSKTSQEGPFFEKSLMSSHKVWVSKNSHLNPKKYDSKEGKGIYDSEGINQISGCTLVESILIDNMLHSSDLSNRLLFSYFPQKKFAYSRSYATYAQASKETLCADLVNSGLFSKKRYYQHICSLGWNVSLLRVMNENPTNLQEMVNARFVTDKQRTLLHFAVLGAWTKTRYNGQGFLPMEDFWTYYPSWERVSSIYYYTHYNHDPYYLRHILHGNFVGTIRLLISKGADPHASDSDGRSPLSIARQYRLQDIENALNSRK